MVTDRIQRASGPALSERLQSYPPFTPLHLGAKLSKAQAEANLTQLREAVPERLKIVSSFLQQEQLDPSAALAQKDPRSFLNALWNCGRPQWSAAPQSWRGVRSWRDYRREGEDILLSFLSDVGVLLGELIRGFRPEYHWAMVDGREERDMSYYRQPVLKIDAPRPDCDPSYYVFDLIDEAIHTGTEELWPADVYGNKMLAAVSDCVLGAYEWSWKGFGVVPPTQSWETFLANRAAGAP